MKKMEKYRCNIAAYFPGLIHLQENKQGTLTSCEKWQLIDQLVAGISHPI